MAKKCKFNFMKTKRHNITPAVFLALLKDHKILLLKRQNTGHWDGYYSLIAGHVHSVESFTKAMAREAKEEANILLKTKNLKFIHLMNRVARGNPTEIKDRVDIFFTTTKWQGKIKNNEPHKCSDLGWFPLNQLPKNTIPYIKQAIQNMKKKKIYSEYGF